MLLSAVLFGACSDDDDDNTAEKSGSMLVEGISSESHTLNFMVTANNMIKCAYKYIENGQQIPSDKIVLEEGTPLNNNGTTSVKIEYLQPETKYTIIVAGDDGNQIYSKQLQMTTTKSEKALSHTVLLYMMGNNGLEKYMDNNLSKVKSVANQIPENGRLAVFYDRGNYTNLTEIYRDEETGHVKQRMIKEFVPDKTSSVNPDFMEDIMNEVMKNFKTDTYGLIMSSHGGGWVPSDIFDLYLTERGLGSNVNSTRFFGQDGRDCMEIPDLKNVLSKFNFDYIIFDACFMASVEALYELRSTTDHIIASAAEIMGAGFPYKEVIPMLYTEDHSLKQICESFMDFYKDQSGTIALVDCKAMDNLADAMSKVVEVGKEPNSVSDIQAYEGFKSHLYFDFEQYVEALTDNQDVLNNFRQALNQAVVYKGHTSTVYTAYIVKGETNHYLPLSRSCGLTCHINQADFPETHKEYLKTSWAKRIGINK